VILATAGVVVGLAVGIIVVALINGSGGGGEPQPYQPFFIGTSERVAKRIQSEGPECYPDLKKGDRSFCLDLDGDQFVALHVVPPGGTAACLVQWDRKEKRYEDCQGAPVDRNILARFPVLTREIGGKISVFVDVREAAAPGRG
jgi:hypothetical protein